MSVLIVTAINTTTDVLTSVAHGKNTGDGPATVYVQDGTYPGGLAAVTDVWFIRVDADNFKLATSNANALLGTAINITSTGSGTIRVLDGIPYRRARTYVAGSQVKSVDLDAMQDTLTAIWNFLTNQAQTILFEKQKRGARVRKISPLDGQNSGGTYVTATVGGSVFYTGEWKSTLATEMVGGGIVVEEGERITKVEARVHGDTTQVIKLEVYKTAPNGTATSLGAAASATTNTDQTLSVSGLAEDVAADGASYAWACTTITNAAIATRLFTIEVTTVIIADG